MAETARANFARNIASLAVTQPALVGRTSALLSAPWSWAIARDGSLTTRRPLGEGPTWWARCSLPTFAAREQLRSLDGKAVSVCFVDPPHPAYLRLSLDAGPANRVLIAVVPDAAALPLLLGASDLSADIAGHRLWFAAGESWAAELRDLLTVNPGLATPTQFVRLNLPDMARLDPVLADARRVLVDVAADRSAQAAKLVEGWSPATLPNNRVCIVASRTWRLGDEAGAALATLGTPGTKSASSTATSEKPGWRSAFPENLTADVLYSDDPATGSTFELLRRALRCDAMLTADLARGDLPDLFPPAFPWVTWMTTPRVPSAKLAGPNDRLLVVDPAWVDAAIAASWSPERVAIADYPGIDSGTGTACRHARETRSEDDAGSGEDTGMNTCPFHSAIPANAVPHVAVLADVCSTDAPESLEEFSSHRLLWDALRDEIRRDPYCIGSDAESFVRSRLSRFDIATDGVDVGLFVRRLVEPELATTLVRRLVAEGVSVRVFGSGWDGAGFSSIWGGTPTSRRQTVEAARHAAALVDVRPAGWRNAMYSLGVPVVRTAGRSMLAVRQEIASALAGRLGVPDPSSRLTLDRVFGLEQV